MCIPEPALRVDLEATEVVLLPTVLVRQVWEGTTRWWAGYWECGEVSKVAAELTSRNDLKEGGEGGREGRKEGERQGGREREGVREGAREESKEGERGKGGGRERGI